jgi:hypothetical protein
MSSAVVSTSAAWGRPFVFDEEVEPEVRPFTDSPEPVVPESSSILFQSTISNQQSTISPIGNRKSAIGIPVAPASRLEIRPAPEMVSSGVPAIDALTGGLPRGCLTKICGPASSGRTTLLLAALAAATRRGEFCAVVDASDALDPQSTAAAGVGLERLLWVRCGESSSQKNRSPQRHRDTEKKNQEEGQTSSQAELDFNRVRLKENVSRRSEHCLEQVLRATDLLLESGGFGMIVLDLGDLPIEAARRIPLTTWFRFRRAVEYKPTILLAIEQQPIAGSCSSLLLRLGAQNSPEKGVNEGQAGASGEVARKSLYENFSRSSGTGRNLPLSPALEAPGYCQAPLRGVDFPPHAQLLTGFNITAEIIRSRGERKPARPVTFATKTAWAG